MTKKYWIILKDYTFCGLCNFNLIKKIGMDRKHLLERNVLIEIASGEGEEGTVEDYKGTISARAIKAKLTQERCG